MVTASRPSAATKATVSVKTVESGSSVRSKRMLVTIELRTRTAFTELVKLVITSWNGTTAQAIWRACWSPGRSRTAATRKK